jgi:hypothetical protein
MAVRYSHLEACQADASDCDVRSAKLQLHQNKGSFSEMPRKEVANRTADDVLRSINRATDRRMKAKQRLSAQIAARVPREGYEPCIVSFIDVLGFRNLLDTHHAHDIRDMLLRLREFTAPDEEKPSRRMKEVRLQSRAFADSVSDAVVRVRAFDTQFSDGAFFQELLDLLHAQVSCICTGVVIRAGVAIGDAHVGMNGEGPVFGPAMVRAYEIESQKAIQPRIVIDEEAYQRFLSDERLRKDGHDLDDELEYVNRLLRIDADGTRFVDYLGASESEFDDPAGYFLFLKAHADLVRGKLAVTSDRVRAKFEWLAAYHNSTVTKILSEFADGRRSEEGFSAEFSVDPVPFLQNMVIDVSA